MSSFLKEYDAHVAERASMANGFGIAPKPLDATQASTVIDELKTDTGNDRLLDLLVNRIPPGVDEAAYVKATWLSALALGKESHPAISRAYAVQLLGTMQGGYNVSTLVDLLKDSDAEIADLAAKELSHTLLVFDAFYDIEVAAKEGNAAAQKVLESWANAEWFLNKPEVPEKMTATVFKVTGETNTDDLSPAQDAWSRPDIPLHAVAMLKNSREGIDAEKELEIGPLGLLDELKKQGHPLAYVGDVVGTGSSRKSATNSVLWHMGDDIPYIPNIRAGGFLFDCDAAFLGDPVELRCCRVYRP